MAGFRYQKVAGILAEAHFTSRKAVIKKYQISEFTYDSWGQRLKKDEKLKKLYENYIQKMTDSWQAEALEMLKETIKVSMVGLKNHPFDDKPKKDRPKEIWGKNMSAMSNLLKTMGDLNISTHVLFEEDDEEDEDEETQED